MKIRLRCAICGKEILDYPTRDHVFPRALYKWSEAYLSNTDYQSLVEQIEGPDNLTITHRMCNLKKAEEIPSVQALFLDDDRKDLLARIGANLSGVTSFYLQSKQTLLDLQSGRCRGCGKPLSGHGILRRIDPEKARTWNNACLVCSDCNENCSDFISVGGSPEISCPPSAQD